MSIENLINSPYRIGRQLVKVALVSSFLIGNTNNTAVGQTGENPQVFQKSAIELYIDKHKSDIKREVEQRYHIGIGRIYLSFFDKLQGIMMYDRSTDRILVDIGKQTHQGANNELHYDLRPDVSVKRAFVHEIGHKYITDILTILKKEEKMHPEYEQFGRFCPIACAQISEGIAEYFRYEFSGKQKMPDRAWPKDVQGLFTFEIGNKNPFHHLVNYEISYMLVKPILDSLGVEAGVKRILSNAPPRKEESLNPGQYWQRVILPQK